MKQLKLKTTELRRGHVVSPFGKVTDIQEVEENKYRVFFENGKSRIFRKNTTWRVDPLENERETEVVSHRRRAVNPEEESLYGTPPVLDTTQSMESYAQNFHRHAEASQQAVQAARAASATNPEGAVLFLHEATVYAALAQAHATMATAVATRSASVEIAVKEM